MDSALERGLAIAAVTVLFDTVRKWRWALGNEIVLWVQQNHARFRPDLGAYSPLTSAELEELFARISRGPDDDRTAG